MTTVPQLFEIMRGRNGIIKNKQKNNKKLVEKRSLFMGIIGIREEMNDLWPAIKSD